MEEQFYYLTKEGLKKLKQEYESLKAQKMEKIKKGFHKVSSSAEEDAEYFAYREELSFLATRLATLENILKRAKPLKLPPKEEQNRVHLGAIVTLEDEDGRINEYLIVESVEANPTQGKISRESPVGKALLNQKIGDKIMITSPIRVVYRIKKIRYRLRAFAKNF